jgi:hypothetical protein
MFLKVMKAPGSYPRIKPENKEKKVAVLEPITKLRQFTEAHQRTAANFFERAQFY